jgi:hypothetical protein
VVAVRVEVDLHLASVQVTVSVRVFVPVRVTGELLATGALETEDTTMVLVRVLVKVDLETEVEVEVKTLEELGTTTAEVETAAEGVAEVEWVMVQGQSVMVRVVASVTV